MVSKQILQAGTSSWDVSCCLVCELSFSPSLLQECSASHTSGFVKPLNKTHHCFSISFTFSFFVLCFSILLSAKSGSDKLSSQWSRTGKHTIQNTPQFGSLSTLCCAFTARYYGEICLLSSEPTNFFLGKINPECVRHVPTAELLLIARFCPVRGGDPVGSMAAAFSKVSITLDDIRGELSYLTDMHYTRPVILLVC